MREPLEAPFGSWSSPVSARSLTADTVNLQEPRLDGADVYWLEGRPSDGGRVVIVRRTTDGSTRDVTSAPHNVRSRVNEYGGGAYDVAGGVVCYVNFDDRRVYRIDVDGSSAGGGSADATPEPEAEPQPEAEPRPITPEGDLRYGDLVVDPGRRRLFAVCEDHGTGGEPANRLVSLDLDGDNSDGGKVLVAGPDFVVFPTPSPDGRRLAWLQWNHPSMPWDESQVCVAEFQPDGTLGPATVVAGGAGESTSQPTWAPDGRLVLISDRTGWWNLYATHLDEHLRPGALEALWPADYDFAGPQWSLSTRSYGIADSGTLVCTFLVDGFCRLGVVEAGGNRRTPLESEIAAVADFLVSGSTVLLTCGYVDRPAEVVRLDLADLGNPQVLRASAPSAARLDPADVSTPEPVSWDGAAGEVHGLYYAPHNPGFRGPQDERPPLIVASHGGPTSMSPPTLDLRVQYWTTRGFAVLAVNYGGSSGYGRAYRERLRGQWGVLDVADCAGGATAMVEQSRADAGRLAIRGGSAGGYTTLAALTFTDVFHCGASYFGIGDLETLVRDTHKFESRYGDGMIGPYPECAELYRERSPVHHVDQIACPLILLQGRDDPVVPLNQAEDMAAAVRAKGLPVALIVFDGEGHGFRRAETIIAATEAEASFYSRVFGFELADKVPPVHIENLPAASG